MSAGLLQLDEPIKIPLHSFQENITDIESSEGGNSEEFTPSGDETDQSIESVQTNGELSDEEKILDILLPPLQLGKEENDIVVQRASRVSPGRNDVIKLWEQLDIKLQENQARLNGICTIRRSLYSEAFDEMIRQVTLDCSERGLLLARVRDEASMTIAAFQSLFNSAAEFGASKAIQAESGKSTLEGELISLEERVANGEAEVRRLEAWCRQVKRRTRERKEVQMTLFTEELECLQRSEQQYQILIETLLSSRSSN